MQTTRFIITAAVALAVNGCRQAHTAVETFAEPADPHVLTAEEQFLWDDIAPGFHAAWGNADLRYSRSVVPTTDTAAVENLVAWRGERESALVLVWAADTVPGLRCRVADFVSDKGTLPGSIADARFVRYTLSDPEYKLGTITDSLSKALLPDMIDSLQVFDMNARTVRPLWLTVTVPQDAEPAMYSTTVTLESADGLSVDLPLTLEVQNHTLPSADKWNYHLDLWQHPTSVARAYGLEVWSDEHFEALRPIMSRLATAGQKVITATLNKDPWNHQCYDGYAPMINWIRNADGTWSYDYAVFDRWVELMMSVGIDKMINCYSMVPWNCELEYYDQATGDTVTVVANPGTEVFEQMWEPFLADFKQHLSEKGWLEITNIAMDERAPEAMDATVELVARCAPELGLALADDHKSYRRYPNLRDICINQNHPSEHADIVARRIKGLNTTFYVCCGPAFPNTFVFSAPYEAELLGWYGLAADFDGMLRWTYNSWPADPQSDACYGYWSAGDTFMVYPYNRSSVRFERLIDGIEAAEKTRLLRAQGTDTQALDSVLTVFTGGDINDPSQPWRQRVKQAREILDSISR